MNKHKINILLIEDDPMQAELLQKTLEETQYHIVGIADQLTEALGLFYATEPDIVIVDIYLGGIAAGIDFVNKINQNESTRKPCIFLTQHGGREVFEAAKATAPYHYLMKPFNPLELDYAIELAIERFNGEVGQFSTQGLVLPGASDFIFVKHQNRLKKIPFDDISYISVEGKYCNLHTAQGTYLIQLALKEMEAQFARFGFIRIHRNYVLAIQQIKEVILTDRIVVLQNHLELPFSQNFRKSLLDKMNIYR